MAEVSEDRAADYAHILTDLHQQAKETAALRAELGGAMILLNAMYGQLSDMRAAVDELLPAARRAAAMLDTPVTAYLAARKEAASAERMHVEPRGRRSRRKEKQP